MLVNPTSVSRLTAAELAEAKYHIFNRLEESAPTATFILSTGRSVKISEIQALGAPVFRGQLNG